MIAKYENLEEYIEAIKGETTQPVYMGIIKSQNENNMLSFQIYIQVVSTANKNIVLTFAYSDIPAFRLIPDGTFETFIGEGETSAIAKKKYEDSFKIYTAKVIEEKEKIITKLKELGFTRFENASLM